MESKDKPVWNPKTPNEPSGVLGICWWVHRVPGLEIFLDRPLAHRPFFGSRLTAVAGWGRKKSYFKALAEARSRGIPCLTLEDGFLRSVGLGSEEPPLSVILDDQGIYYDASHPSRLENLISGPYTEEQRRRARSLITAWRAARVSKYNHAREGAPLPHGQADSGKPYVLVVDQTRGDASVRHGMADGGSFERMLAAALREYPEHMVVLKVHPEVLAGRKQGHFDPAGVVRNPRVRVLGEDVHPVALIEHAEAVYAVTSQMGFEALLWGRPVRTFGMPFYAGWGLTEDEMPPPDRRRPVPLEHLVHAALVDYPVYLDPETGQRCEPERLIEWMGLQRARRQRFPQRLYACGFSIWKRAIVKRFFQGSEVRFIRRPMQVPDGGTLVVWGRRDW